jgi:tRNA (adenine57-N1/adenine58-N1)-methyltransferase
MKAGEFVLLYHSDRINYLVMVQEKGSFSTHRGQLTYGEIQQHEYGDAVRTHLGFLFFLLRPALADLSVKVRRTTTISYAKDAGMMLLRALVFPGARVIETGSGSGGLTTILASFVRPTGRVYSYERRPEFSANARANVARYGLDKHCEFFVRDPEHEGFDQVDVDAVFLDVPEPWALVATAHKALRGGYVLASISPTFEQVRKTVSAMEMQGFTRIHVEEILQRQILVRASGMRPADRMVAHTVYLIFGHKVNQTGLAAVTMPEGAEKVPTPT